MSRAWLLALLLGCAPQAMSMTPDHPASPDAPAGRLAGPPAALRPGVDAADTSEPAAPIDHSQHQHDAAAQPAAEHNQPVIEDAPKPVPKAAKKPRNALQPAASKPVPDKSSSETAKEPPEPPAHQGHEGHH